MGAAELTEFNVADSNGLHTCTKVRSCREKYTQRFIKAGNPTCFFVSSAKSESS